jgi:hypothetical protein
MHRVIHQNEEFLFLNIDVPKHTTDECINKTNSPLTAGK